MIRTLIAFFKIDVILMKVLTHNGSFGENMKVEKNKVVSIAYQVRTAEDGVLVDEAVIEAPLSYLQGADNLITGLEKALEGKAIGDVLDVEVSAAEAYGDFNDALVQNVPKEVFAGTDELEVGMRFLADTDQGSVPVIITAIDGDTVTVDGNHTLAGQDLKFHVEIVDIRDATEEELKHGHVHGAGGHHHHHEHEEDGCCGGHGHHHDKPKEDGCCGGGGHGGCGCH